MTRARIALTIALLLASPAIAQTAKKGKASAPAPAQVSVTQVNDRRSTDVFAELTIRLELTGINSKDVAASRVTVSEASDDTGRDLVNHEKSEERLSPNMRAQFEGAESTPASVDVNLKTPSRDAMTLKSVTGQIELYMPGKDPDSVATIPKFQSLAGKPIVNKALKANGVEISLIGEAQRAAEKKKAVEKKRQEAKAQGNDEDTVNYIVSSFEESFYTPSEGEMMLKVKDPNKRIQEYSFVEQGAEPQRAFVREEQGYVILSSYANAPGPDAGLRITLQTPKAMVKQSFSLKDVALP